MGGVRKNSRLRCHAVLSQAGLNRTGKGFNGRARKEPEGKLEQHKKGPVLGAQMAPGVTRPALMGASRVGGVNLLKIIEPKT